MRRSGSNIAKIRAELAGATKGQTAVYNPKAMSVKDRVFASESERQNFYKHSTASGAKRTGSITTFLF